MSILFFRTFKDKTNLRGSWKIKRIIYCVKLENEFVKLMIWYLCPGLLFNLKRVV